MQPLSTWRARWRINTKQTYEQFSQPNATWPLTWARELLSPHKRSIVGRLSNQQKVTFFDFELGQNYLFAPFLSLPLFCTHDWQKWKVPTLKKKKN